MTKYKPKKDENYYYIFLDHGGDDGVTRDFWVDAFYEEKMYQEGKIFKTKKEAQEMLSKIKKLLKK